MASIFSRIVAGEIPCYKVAEDENYFAFLDISPVAKGHTVKIKNVKNGAVMTYTIVSESEANLREGKISATTPIAKGLLGKKVGDIAEIQVPSGLMSFEIVDISI